MLGRGRRRRAGWEQAGSVHQDSCLPRLASNIKLIHGGKGMRCNAQAICLKPLPILAGCGYQCLVPLTRLNYGALRRHRHRKDYL